MLAWNIYSENYRKKTILIFGILVSLDVYFKLTKIQRLVVSALFHTLNFSLAGDFWKRLSELTLKPKKEYILL